MTTGISQALSTQGQSLLSVLQEYLGFLPDAVLNGLSDALQQPLADATTNVAGEVANQVVMALQPVLMPLLQSVLFLLLCVVIRWLVGLVSRTMQLINHIPLVGTVNRTLGLVLGLISGLLDCWVLSLVLWGGAAVTGGSVDLLSQQTLNSSLLYNLFAALNPFLA